MLIKVNDKGNIHEVNLLDVTAENYIVPDGEKNTYHCRIEMKSFDPYSGKRKSVPRIQKFGRKEFETSIFHTLKNQGYTVDVLYNPTEWLKEQEELIANGKKVAEAKRKEAEEARIQARIDEAVEKAVAEALAKVTAKRNHKKSEV